MRSDNPSANGSSGHGALPPVEPPNPRFIAQLFLIPGALVAIVFGFIWLFFGWLGTGLQDPDKLANALENATSDTQRWKVAQDLAQVLPRDQELRGNVRFALKLTEVLHRESQKPPPKIDRANHTIEGGPDPVEFLPSAVAHFYAPVVLPQLQDLVSDYRDKVKDAGALSRLRNAVVAIGIQGSRVQEFDKLPQEQKDRILAELNAEAGDGPGRPTWARLARDYLQLREKRQAGGSGGQEPYHLAATLAQAARAQDELTRGYTVLALSNWDEPGMEPVLRDLAGDQSDLPDEAFARAEQADAGPLTAADRERGIREIRYNAALGLARRGSPMTPWDLVLQTLDEPALRKEYATPEGRTLSRKEEDNQQALATQWVLKALYDLHKLKQADPKLWAEQKEVTAAVARLAKESPTLPIQMEAQKLLGAGVERAAAPARMSREVLFAVALGFGVLVLLALAVIARWQKKPDPTQGAAPGGGQGGAQGSTLGY